MAPKNKANVKTTTNLRSSSPIISRRTRKLHLTYFLKHRKPKADKMARKKKAIVILKSKLKLNRIRENIDRKLQGEAPSGQQQRLALPSNNGLINYSPDNELVTALERQVPLSNHPQQMQGTRSSQVQYPPPNVSQDQPSGGFFEGPTEKVEIKGGTINHTLGHHMNFTIQVNPSREEQYHTLQQYPHLPPVSTLSQTSNHDIASPPAQAADGGQIPSMAMFEQGPSTSTTIFAPNNGNKIYERHLGLTQRGFPLWIPEPNTNLPMPYRRKGVNVGDVGIITPNGGFSFLFNICLPYDNPINPRTLPDGFAPIYPSIEPMDVRGCSEFKPESYLASTAIEKIHNDPPFSGLSFATSATEGAVLTLPDGAISRDLENISRFRAYAAANIESWYRYVNGPRGREAKNGEVRLVTGCDKATSWGMAAVANMTQHKTHYLKYRSIGDGGAIAPIPLYKWEYTGLAQARVGPDLAEIEDLRRNDDSDVALGGKYWNQSLFIRTLNPTLNDEVFAAINREVESALVQELQHFQNKGGSSDLTIANPTNTGARTSGPSQQTRINSSSQTRSTKKSFDASNFLAERVTTSRSPSAPKSHPTDVLNEVLLQKVPNCRVVITHDKDWCSVINEGDKIMPSPSEIAKRVLAAHHVREANGVVFLEAKKERQSNLHQHEKSSSQSTEGDMIRAAARVEGKDWQRETERQQHQLDTITTLNGLASTDNFSERRKQSVILNNRSSWDDGMNEKSAKSGSKVSQLLNGQGVGAHVGAGSAKRKSDISVAQRFTTILQEYQQQSQQLRPPPDPSTNQYTHANRELPKRQLHQVQIMKQMHQQKRPTTAQQQTQQYQQQFQNLFQHPRPQPMQNAVAPMENNRLVLTESDSETAGAGSSHSVWSSAETTEQNRPLLSKVFGIFPGRIKVPQVAVETNTPSWGTQLMLLHTNPYAQAGWHNTPSWGIQSSGQPSVVGALPGYFDVPKEVSIETTLLKFRLQISSVGCPSILNSTLMTPRNTPYLEIVTDKNVSFFRTLSDQICIASIQWGPPATICVSGTHIDRWPASQWLVSSNDGGHTLSSQGGKRYKWTHDSQKTSRHSMVRRPLASIQWDQRTITLNLTSEAAVKVGVLPLVISTVLLQSERKFDQ